MLSLSSLAVSWHDPFTPGMMLIREAWNGDQKMNRRMLTFMMTPMANIMEASAEPP